MSVFSVNIVKCEGGLWVFKSMLHENWDVQLLEPTQAFRHGYT